MASRSSRAARWILLPVLYAALGLVAPARAYATGASPETASADEKARAQVRYEKAVKEYKGGDYADAAKDFQASHEIVASPNSHMMFARALREAGESGRAYEEFALTQDEAGKLAVTLPRYATAAESAEAEKKEMLKKVAAISVEIQGDASTVTVYVGSREVPHARWRAIAVKPGSVDVTARVTGGRRIWRSVKAEIGQVARVTFDVTHAEETGTGPLRPPAHHDTSPSKPETADTGTTRAHPLRPYAYIAGGVGAAGLLTFTIAGAMSRATYSDLESTCKNHVCPPGQAGDIDKGKTQQTIANVGLAIGVVGVGAGVALFIIDLKQKPPAGDSARRLELRAGPGSVAVGGTF